MYYLLLWWKLFNQLFLVYGAKAISVAATPLRLVSPDVVSSPALHGAKANAGLMINKSSRIGRCSE
jgi:hypothetical protein